MNDPGLEGPISNAESEAKNVLRPESSDGMDQRTSSLMSPARWWYASTAFPLVAGTFGPVANAFSICALVENWRVEIPPGGTEEHGIDIKDPRWLIAVNAVSLAFALTANLSLLLNMAKRVRFEIAQPITILGFWVASVLLIGLQAYAGTSSGFHAEGVRDQALTQAYYYGIFASGIYQIISYLMCITVWGAYRGAYSKDFNLTVAQRTLMLQTISYLCYLLVGALVYCKIEQWRYLDAVYWASVTLLTVGLGDYTPATHLGRSLLFPFAIGGIITVGLVISSIRSLVLDRGAEKLSARAQEKTRARVVKQIAEVDQRRHMPKSPIFGVSKRLARDLAREPEEDDVDELRRRKTEFEAMRQVQRMAVRERTYAALAVSTSAFALLWFIGALVFKNSERNQGWTYFQSLYFSYTSIITIGYGDFFPMSNSGRPFFVFWSLLAVPTLTVLISNMGDTVVKGIKDITIWIGEISFLPSNDARMRDRLKKGAHRLTGGFVSHPGGTDKDKFEPEDADDWSAVEFRNPGMFQVFDISERRKIHRDDLQLLDRLTQIWAKQEEEDEEAARVNHDNFAEAAHHYRHLLISHISKVYADTKLSTPKQYSYLEWSFYLRLIGESESDGSLHRRARPKSRGPQYRKKKGKRPGEGEAGDHEDKFSKAENDSGWSKWSWIGPQSPLMQGEDEAEWILQRLFQQLEASLRQNIRAPQQTLEEIRDPINAHDGSDA